MLISLKSGSTLPSRPEITLNSRAGCPDTGTAHPKGLICALNSGNILKKAFYLGNVGLTFLNFYRSLTLFTFNHLCSSG